MSAAGEHVRRLKQRAQPVHCGACKRREERISSHLTRFRDKSRITAHAGACPDDPFCAGNLVELAAYRTPSGDVAPGASVPVDVDLKNHGTGMGPFDPDRCGRNTNPCGGGGATAGVCVELVFSMDWANDRTQLACSHVSLSPPQTKTVSVSLPSAGREGSLSTSVYARLAANPDTRSRAITQSINFDAGGSTNPNPQDGNGGTNGGGGGPWLPCLIDPTRSCESAADTIVQGGAIVLLLLVAVGQAV